MLPPDVKAGIRKAAAAVASGKMKPGDSMIMRSKDHGPEEMDDEEMPADDQEGDKSEEFHSIAQDMMSCLKEGDVDGLSMLLEEFCQHCKESY